MRARIIKIGNSQGIRIPKTVLQQCDIQKEVDIEIKGNLIILKPLHKKAREGWSEAFKQMKKNKSRYGTRFSQKVKPARKDYVIRNKRR